MRIFNTLTRKMEEFAPQVENEVKMYACGPTVYNLIHIGNARPIITFDTLRRYFEWRGMKVTFVQNFTDVDDKIINKAKAEGVDFKTVSERYIEEYWKDVKALGVKPATIHPKATENIDKIIEIISTLVEKGHAYEAQGDVYFSTKTFPSYGKLSHLPLRFRSLEGRQRRRTLLGFSVGQGQTRLAHRVLRDESRPSRRDHRPPLRRTGPDLPAP